jgi:hypothetical protein
MPKLVRFVIVNSLIGVLIGWLVAAALIWFDVLGFGDILLRSDSKIAAIFMLGVSFGVTFGFAYLTTAILLMPTRKDDFDRL